jgi:gliding motility-associated-like protein
MNVSIQIQKLIFSIVLILLNSNDVWAQKINCPTDECFKNITGFSYTSPTGLTATSYNWSFGDGSTSSQTSPQYIYKNPGTYLVILNTNFSNNSSRIDSVYINVHSLPTAKPILDPKSDFCLNNNNVCVLDSSTKGANNQTIVNTLILWGNGNYVNVPNPNLGAKTCYKYSQKGNFSIKIEVTDIYGCKDAKTVNVNVKEQSKAKFTFSESFKDCKTKTICLRNKSTGPNVNNAIFLWQMTGQPDDSNAYINTSKCIDITGNINGSVKFYLTDQNGCKDFSSTNFNINIDSLPTSMTITKDTVCYGNLDNQLVIAKSVENDFLKWYVDGNPNNVSNGSALLLNAKSYLLKPGTHIISLVIGRGTCTTTLYKNFTVLGPVAATTVINPDDCYMFTKNPVYFVNEDSSNNKKNCTYDWYMNDYLADTCIANRKLKQDTSWFCERYKDYFAVHYFRDKMGKYYVKQVVSDSIIGCKDSSTVEVSFLNCPIILDTAWNLCTNDKIDFGNTSFQPNKVSIDSGKTWHNLPFKITKAIKNGVYDVWFTFKNTQKQYPYFIRMDSLKVIHDTISYLDTIKKSNFLYVHSLIKDSISYTIEDKCEFQILTIKFKDGYFYAGSKITLAWGNGSNTVIKFNKDSILKSFQKIYYSSGINSTVSITVENEYKCSYSAGFEVSSGKILTITNIKDFHCNLEPICPKLDIVDMKTKKSWGSTKISQSSTWFMDSFNNPIKNSSPCFNFTNPGSHLIYYVFNDSVCQDTLSYQVHFQIVKANVQTGSKTIYCNELKQFHDSSYVYLQDIDPIVSYVWDFGSGYNIKPQKNPFISLNTSARSIPVKLEVTTSLGCKDFFKFELKIVSSFPYFIIKDTIACEKMDAVFFNFSENCSGYIWEFGDDNNTILPKQDLSTTNFSYLKPGRYHIKLYGYDSIYNPSTRSKYFCKAEFPDPLFHKDSIRDIIVLPKLSTKIISKDTICPNEIVKFESSSSYTYDLDHWEFEDSSATVKSDKEIFKQISGNGQYVVKLRPGMSQPEFDICSDTSYKTIYILDISADFDINLGAQWNMKQFKNKSQPINAQFSWDFGDPSSSDNHSNMVHPSHTYSLDSGTYQVCLVAALPLGCVDTSCKIFFIGEQELFQIFNVFTPGDDNMKNDVYDILIIGESYYHLTIFNRWGIKVYEGFNDEYENNWNGRCMNNGEICPAGTYYYVFDYKMLSSPDDKKTISGTVTLIR